MQQSLLRSARLVSLLLRVHCHRPLRRQLPAPRLLRAQPRRQHHRGRPHRKRITASRLVNPMSKLSSSPAVPCARRAARFLETTVQQILQVASEVSGASQSAAMATIRSTASSLAWETMIVMPPVVLHAAPKAQAMTSAFVHTMSTFSAWFRWRCLDAMYFSCTEFHLDKQPRCGEALTGFYGISSE